MMHVTFRHIALGVVLASALAIRVRAERVPKPPVARQDFDSTIAPLIVRRCLDCHSGPKPKGGLDLTRRAPVLEGGKSGAALVPGKPEESLLWKQVESGKMPPKKPLADAEKTMLKAWIN